MILQIDGWKFDIDMVRTMEFSAREAAEHCDCAYCRNFYAAVDGNYPQLRPFLARFGVDIEAPEEMLPVIDTELLYDPTYKVYGKILSFGSYEMACGSCSLIARKEDADADWFLLDCYGVILPWILDEPLQEVVSPANEPSLLRRMWQKFLERLSKSSPTA